MYFIGVTRFSLYSPGSKSWKISSASEEDYLKELFSDERMRIRFDIFINKALPIYEVMAKEFFYKHIVQYSSLMPEFWKQKLKEETKKYSFIVLSESDRDTRPLPIIQLLNGQSSGTLVYFRVDDDDLLSKDYLNNLAKYSHSSYEGMIVSFGSGTIALYNDGKFIDFRQCHRRFLALGMAFIGRYDSEKVSYWLPKAGSHERVDKTIPTIVDSRVPLYIWTQNISQDTKFKVNDATGHIFSMLNDYEPLKNTNNLKKSFPTMVNEINEVYSNGDFLISLRDKIFYDPSMVFPVTSKNRVLRYLISYEVVQDEDAETIHDSERSMIISFDFETKPKTVNGLTLSKNLNIGWYSYIPMTKGIGKRSFIVNLDNPNKIQSISLSRYHLDSSIKVKIKSLNISEMGNIF